MNRLALSLLLVGAMAPAARAEGTRSLGVTVSPVGAWAATRFNSGLASGLSAGVDWSYRREGAWASMGGHVASSVLFTEATPFRLRVGPTFGPFHPFVGVGASLLLPWADADGNAIPDTTLKLGAEVSAGVDVQVGERIYVAGEGRYQNFSAHPDPFSPIRQDLFSAYLGVGFQL